MDKNLVYSYYLIGFASGGQSSPAAEHLVAGPVGTHDARRLEALAGLAAGVADRVLFDAGEGRDQYPRSIRQACAAAAQLLEDRA